MEDAISHKINSKALNINHVISQVGIDTVVTTTLNNLNNEHNDPKIKVYKMSRPSVAARYNLRIGGERVIANHVVMDIYNKRNDGISVNIPESVMEMYKNRTEVQKDDMATCLLQAVLFYESLITDKSKSISVE